MNRLLDNETATGAGYSSQRYSGSDSEREISLGMPTILGIFFALALVCACFFGFGYTMGRKSGQSSIPSADTPSLVATNAPKPTAAGPGAQPQPSVATQATANPAATPTAQTVAVPLTPPAAHSAATPADAAIVGDKIPAPVSQPVQPARTFYVQVAAVSSQDVADILLGSLQKKGYTVAIHHEAQDKLLHVQIGPFNDKKEAEAMRQRVIADGFNAIVK